MPLENILEAETGPASSFQCALQGESRGADPVSQKCLSPFSRLMQQALYCTPAVFQPFPGIVIETLAPRTVDKEYRLSVKTETEPLIFFSLRLSGTCTTTLESDPSQEITHGTSQLAVWYFPGEQCDMCLQPSECSDITISVTPETLAELCRKQLPSELIRLLHHKDGLRAIISTASPRLVEMGGTFLKLPVSPTLQSLYLQGSSLAFLAICLDIIQQTRKPGPSVLLSREDIAQLTKIKQHIENNLVEPSSLHELSKLFYLNEFKLKNGFKQLFGMTVAAYVQYCRMTHAHSRFVHGETNVSQCAWEVGYTNVSHFIAAFRRYYGHTPGEFIRMQKASLIHPSLR